MKNNYVVDREFTLIGLDPTKHQIVRKVAWGVAMQNKDNYFKYIMVEGPFESKNEALNIKGERGARIIFFMRNGGDIITHYWHNNCWIKKRKSIRR